MSNNYSDNQNYGYRKRPERGSRPMLVIGIILLNISLFLAAFVLSFNMIVNPIEQRDEQVRSLTEENVKLKSDAKLLQDQLDVVESELESYKKKSGSSSSSSSSSSYSYDNYLNDDNSFIRDADDDDEDADTSSASNSSRSRNDDEMNMDDN